MQSAMKSQSSGQTNSKIVLEGCWMMRPQFSGQDYRKLAMKSWLIGHSEPFTWGGQKPNKKFRT